MRVCTGCRDDSIPKPPHPGLVPIVVGITGHRDIPAADYTRLAEVVRQQLVTIASAHPNSPCILLSGMAEGADLLAVQCALEVGWNVGAALPLPQAEFESDFTNEASRAEFRSLLARCDWIRVVADAGTPRPECYRQLGEWLARHSQQAIVLWNGDEASYAPGGTADVVKLFREGLPLDRPVLPDARQVIHVLTRRGRDVSAIADKDVGRVELLAPQPAGLPSLDEAERWRTIWKRIDRYNYHARLALDNELTEITNLRSYLNSDATISEAKATTAANAASWMYAVAGAMSSAAQKKRDRIFLWMIALGALAIFFAQLYSGPFPNPGLMAAAIAAGGLGVVLYWHVESVQLENRSLDYRGLSEACRVQYYWQQAGIFENVASFYLRDQRDEIEWLRQALITTELGASESPDVTLRSLEKVRDQWVVDQLKYFAGTPHELGKAEQNKVLNRRWSTRAFWFMCAGISVALVATLFHGFVATALGKVGGRIVQGLIVTYSMLFAAAGISKVYQETKAFSELANRYQSMALSMRLARTQIDTALAAGDLQRAQQAIFAIGYEALEENTAWLLIHRERPVKVPLG